MGCSKRFVDFLVQRVVRFEQLWLLLWPLVSDALRDGIYRTSREKALGKRYVEANPDALSNLLVVDIDHQDALLRALWEREGWRPNAVVENPANGHAHAIWVLSAPFPRTESPQAVGLRCRRCRRSSLHSPCRNSRVKRQNVCFFGYGFQVLPGPTAGQCSLNRDSLP